MSNTQKLLNELYQLYPDLIIKIEYSYQLYADGIKTPYLIVIFGRELNSNHFDSGMLNKKTGELKFETDLNIESELDDYYEFFEGGYEDDIDDCLIRMIENIKKYKRN